MSDRCTHPECQRDTLNGVTLPCRYPQPVPHRVSLPTCKECLARAAYLADLDTDGKPLDLFDCETLASIVPAVGRMHLYVSKTLAHAPLPLCQCDTRGRWLDATMTGWVRAWSALKARYGDYACPHHGETWQYMGTSYPKGHCFRHRALPPVGDRCYFHVAERPGDFAPALEG